MCLRRNGDGVAIAFVRTFDCGVIFIDKVALDELNCEARLAHTSSTDDDELVFPKKLMRGTQRPVSNRKDDECATGRNERDKAARTNLGGHLAERRRKRDERRRSRRISRYPVSPSLCSKKGTSICGGDGTRRDPGRSDRCQGEGARRPRLGW